MAPYKQDTAPAGGYGQISWERKLPNKRNGFYLLCGFCGFFVARTWYMYFKARTMLEKDVLEENDARLALRPLLEAEEDRRHLARLRASRDTEAYLMRNVPNWQVGKYYNEDLFSSEGARMNSFHIRDVNVLLDQIVPGQQS